VPSIELLAVRSVERRIRPILLCEVRIYATVANEYEDETIEKAEAVVACGKKLLNFSMAIIYSIPMR